MKYILLPESITVRTILLHCICKSTYIFSDLFNGTAKCKFMLSLARILSSTTISVIIRGVPVRDNIVVEYADTDKNKHAVNGT